jgi:excisionase family DNA binding protein
MAAQAVKLSDAVESLSEAMEAVTTAVSSALEVLCRVVEAQEQAGQGSDPGMSIKAVAAELGVSRPSVMNLIKTGRLRAEQHNPGHYTIPRSALAEYRKRASTTGRTK